LNEALQNYQFNRKTFKKDIGQIYQYKKLDLIERQKESRLVGKEYKSGIIDPSRLVAKMERSTMRRKKNMRRGIVLR